MTRRAVFAIASALAALAGCASVPSVAAAPEEFTLALGMTGRYGSLGFEPQRVEEESRCPANVQCVHAGTVRLSVLLTGHGTPRTTVLTLGTPRQAGQGTWLTLTRACPYPTAPGGIRRDQYRFTIAASRTPAAVSAPGPCPPLGA